MIAIQLISSMNIAKTHEYCENVCLHSGRYSVIIIKEAIICGIYFGNETWTMLYKEKTINSSNEIVLFQPNETVRLEVLLDEDTVWLTQAQMVELFQTSKANVSEHIKHIFEEGELARNMVVRKFRTTTKHGAIPDKTQTHLALHYNLDVIISVGYRVKSQRGTQFRIWATGVLS